MEKQKPHERGRTNKEKRSKGFNNNEQNMTHVKKRIRWKELELTQNIEQLINEMEKKNEK